jgi:hypothetical protein
MNLLPEVLGQAAFLEKPQSRKELDRAVGLIKERCFVREERDRPHPFTAMENANEIGCSGTPGESGLGHASRNDAL